MSQQNEFLARVLRNGARAFAGYASGEFIELHADAAEAMGANPFAAWQNWLAARVEELAAAIAVEQPSLFTSQIRWAREILAARGVPVEHFQASMTVLKRVLSDELPEPVQPLANQYLDEAAEAFDDQPTEPETVSPDTPYGRLASTYLLALLEGDRRRASSVILDACDGPEVVRDLYSHVLLPCQVELGRMWMKGEINVAEEHFASHTTKLVMAQLLSCAQFQPPNGKTLLAASVAGNWHDMGIYAVADFFEMDGWRTIQLGADVPIIDLVHAVEFFSADLLGLSASLNVQLETVKSTIQAVRNGSRGDTAKILVGGPAFAGSRELALELGADGFAASADEAVQIGGQLVGATT